MVELLILLVLIVVNGVFAMSEMAIVSSRKARLQQWADDGRPGADAALALANEPSLFLSTIQVGITLIGITSGAFGEATLAKGLSEWLSHWAWLDEHSDMLAITIVVAGITIGSLIIGELLPKRLALLNPEVVASFIAKPMQVLSRAAHPLVVALSFATDTILKAVGLGNFVQPPITEEEIKVLMEQGAAAGVFREHERRLVSRVFRLDQTKVGGIMTPRTDIVCLDLNEPPEANVRTIMAHGHSRFPVIRGRHDNIEGVVLARALLADALIGKPLDLSRHVMTPALYVRTKSSVMELVELFRKRRQTLAIAINEHGAVDGLVTLNDVMQALVGDIATVEEEKERELVKRADGSWWIDGSVTIGRLKTGLDIDTMLPGEEQGGYRTLAGFMIEQLGRVPVVGDKFECVDWHWEVVDMDEKRIDKVLATPVTPRPQRPAETPW